MRKHPQCSCKNGKKVLADFLPREIEHISITDKIESLREAIMEAWMGIYRDKFKFEIFKGVMLFACACLVAKECVEIQIPIRDYVPFEKM